MPNAKETLDRDYLEMRWRTLSLAADFDRIRRADGGESVLASDPRVGMLRQALAILLENKPAKAEAVQNIFSDQTPWPK